MSIPEEEDRVSSALQRLRSEPLDEAFSRRLHMRLAEEPRPRPVGLLARIRAALTEHPMLVGAVGGASATAFAGFLLFAAHGPLEGVEKEPAVAQREPASGVAAPPEAPAPEPEAPFEVYEVPVGRVVIVQLQIESATDIRDARVRVDLPEGLAFYDRGPEERGFVLAADLSAGETPIPLAVRALEPGRHIIEATTVVDDSVVRHRLALEVGGGA